MIFDPFRLGYAACRDHLLARLGEPAPARIQLLTGPRQVGKTTLLLEIAGRLGERAVYGAGDGPEAALPGHWERLFRDAEERGRNRPPAVLLLDEVQHFPRWAARLKAEWDRFRRRAVAVHIVATGSSSLKLGTGARESMAGRFERLTLAHWTARALVENLAIDPDRAPELLVSLGSYPGALALRDDPERCRAYIRDAIAEPALGRDLLALGLVRRPALMREVFLLCTRVPAQIVSLQKLQGQLQDAGALETVAHYLQLLE
jgi:predicted AAA+ superfamily ATPase